MDTDGYMSGRGYIGTVLLHEDTYEARDLARLCFPVGSPADAWAGYRWVPDPSVPRDCFILVGEDRDGQPFRQVVPLERKGE